MATYPRPTFDQIFGSVIADFTKDNIKSAYLADWKVVDSLAKLTARQPVSPPGYVALPLKIDDSARTFTAADITRRQLNAMYKQHTALLETLRGKPSFNQVSSLLTFMEKSLEAAFANNSAEKPNAADYASVESRIVAHMSALPTSIQVAVVRHEPAAAPTDFCAFYDGTRVNSMAGEFGRSEEPNSNSRRKV